MIYYVVTKQHDYTIRTWLEYYHEVLQGRVQILFYSQCHGSLPGGTFIFTDLDRLSVWGRKRATKIWGKLRRAGCRPLNHPSESLRRYDLQKALRNDFRMFRKDEVPDDLRYPVFLRHENKHSGSLTELLHDEPSYREARRKFPDALLVEYLDTQDEAGCFRKYSAMRIVRDASRPGKSTAIPPWRIHCASNPWSATRSGPC